MWWFRSLIIPLTARLAFIQAIEGKPSPWCKTGSVAIALVGRKGNFRASWNFQITALSSTSASACLMGYSESNAQQCNTTFWDTIFLRRVIGSHPTIIGNLKDSTNALSSSKCEAGSLTLVCRNSILSATSSIWCSVTDRGLVLGVVETDWKTAWFGWSFGPDRT